MQLHLESDSLAGASSYSALYYLGGAFRSRGKLVQVYGAIDSTIHSRTQCTRCAHGALWVRVRTVFSMSKIITHKKARVCGLFVLAIINYQDTHNKTLKQSNYCAILKTKITKLWIPAFAGMTI